MSKTLDNQEIDSLIAAAHSSRPSRPSARKKVQRYDVRRSNRLSAQHLGIFTTLHESLARRLANSLGAYLRVGFEMNLAAAEQLSYGDFISKVPELTYCASLHIMPMDVRAAFQADLSLVFPLLDLVLGGTGADPIDPRELTEIEEQIFETVVRLIARDLQSTWAPLIPIDIQFEQRQQFTQVQNLMLPLEKILCLRFDIRLPDAAGSIHLALPAVVANTLLRKLSAQWSVTQRLPSREMRRQLRERLLESRFDARLNLPSCSLSIRQLVALEPGSVLVLPKRAHDPVHLDVAGKAMFLAYPVRFGSKRGARIEERLSIANYKGKEK